MLKTNTKTCSCLVSQLRPGVVVGESGPLTSRHGDQIQLWTGRQLQSYIPTTGLVSLASFFFIHQSLSVKPPVQRLSLISAAVQSLRRQRHQLAVPPLVLG